MAESSIQWHYFCVVLGWLYRAAQTIIHLVLKRVKGSMKNKLPPIRQPLLLESAGNLAQKIRTKQVKSEAVVKAFIDRIQDVNPLLNAVVEDRFEDALKDARNADEYVRTSGKTPEQLAQEKPFLGVPFTTKDAIPVKGLFMTCGVVARKGIRAEKDAEVVANMRKAGAIPLLISNVPEICMWVDGSNRLYGTTHNSYDLTRSPGGSSGGEGALISSACSVIGLGNDIGGSIRIPCAFSGIFGHKPTRRVVSNVGQYPCSAGTVLDAFNVTGPMCRYASDLLPMLKAVAGENASKLKLDTQVDIKKIKVYYPEEFITQGFTTPLDPEIRDAIKKVADGLQSAHGVKVTKVNVPAINKAWSIWNTKIGAADIAHSYEDQGTNGKGASLNIVEEFFKAIFQASEHTLHYLYYILICKIYRSDSMKAVNEENDKVFEELTKTFTEMLGDDGVFLFPTNASTALYQNEQLLKLNNFAYTGLFSFLGNPVTQCPLGLSSEGLPLGVQVVANHHNDHQSLAVAKEIDKMFGGWVAPSAVII